MFRLDIKNIHRWVYLRLRLQNAHCPSNIYIYTINLLPFGNLYPLNNPLTSDSGLYFIESFGTEVISLFSSGPRYDAKKMMVSFCLLNS